MSSSARCVIGRTLICAFFHIRINAKQYEQTIFLPAKKRKDNDVQIFAEY